MLLHVLQRANSDVLAKHCLANAFQVVFKMTNDGV